MIYLTDDFCDFFRDGVANLDNVAHRKLFGLVDVDKLRSLIAEQVALYIALINDPLTAFESNRSDKFNFPTLTVKNLHSAFAE